MMPSRLLKTPSNPAGRPVAEVLRGLHMELQCECIQLPEGRARGVLKQVIGKLIDAEGLVEALGGDGAAPLRLASRR